MNKLLLCLLPLLLVVACKDATSLSERERAEVKDEVKAMLYKYCADVTARGLHAEFEYIDNSSAFSWVPPGARAPLPFDTVISMIGRNAARFRKVNNSFDTLVVTPFTTQLAAYSARIRSGTTDTAGVYSEVSLVETGMVIKRKTGWKLLCGQTSVCPGRVEQ